MGRFIALRPQKMGETIRPEGSDVTDEVSLWPENVVERYILAGDIVYQPAEGEEYHGAQPMQPFVPWRDGNPEAERLAGEQAAAAHPIEEPSTEVMLPDEEDLNWAILTAAPEYPDQDPYPESGRIKDVKEWVDEDPKRAEVAYERESEREKPRTTLVTWLEEVMRPAEEPAPEE